MPHASTGALSVLLHSADSGTRQRLTRELHVRHGNAAVSELLDGRPEHRRSGLASMFGDMMSELADYIGFGEDDAAEAATPIPTASGTVINVREGPPIKVSGSLAQVAASLEARGEAGSVTSHIEDIYYEPETEDPVKLAHITVNETRQLPQWTDKSKAPLPEQAEWDRFFAAITAHEAEHLAIDKRFLTNLHKKCVKRTHADADAAIDKAEADAQVANDEFDAKTDRGRAAGTVINTNVGGEIEKVP